MARRKSKELKLTCKKCGSCTHWEILLVRAGTGANTESILCVKCGLEVPCYFSIDPHEELHYELHTRGEENCDIEPNRGVSVEVA
jgi:hypothetical protein